VTTTLIRNCRFAVVWDDEVQSHVDRSRVDVVMAKDRVAFIGENYDGESDRVLDGASWLVMPGLIDIHSHPFSEPRNKGMWGEVGSPKLYNTSLYEYLPILNPDEDGVKASYGVALSEVLLSGVATPCDISPTEGWLDILAGSGLRVSVAPMFRSAAGSHATASSWNTILTKNAAIRPSMSRCERSRRLRPNRADASQA
jgi:5-methylthioadenosine/S-adenosylhomocysteine deaminase